MVDSGTTFSRRSEFMEKHMSREVSQNQQSTRHCNLRRHRKLFSVSARELPLRIHAKPYPTVPQIEY